MLDECFLYRVLYTITPFLCIAAYGRFIASRGFAWCVLSGLVTYHLFQFVLSMGLGHLGILNQGLFRGGYISLAAVALISGLSGLPSVLRAIGSIRYRPQLIDLAIALSLAISGLTLYFFWVRDWSYGPVHFDSVSYHITRALQWFWHGNFDSWCTANWHHIGLPLGGDAALQPGIFLGCGWLGGAWGSWLATVGAAFALYLIGTGYGLDKRHALLAASALLSFPTIALRVSEVNTDIGAAFPVLAGAAFFLHARSLAKGGFVFAALTGLGAAAKGYIFFAAIPLSLALFLPRFRAIFGSAKVLGGLACGGLVAAIFVLASYLPVYWVFGDLHGSQMGQRLSAYGQPWRSIWMTTLANVVTWSMEPLALLSDQVKLKLFEAIKLESFYRWLTLDRTWFPVYQSGENRTGILPLLALPWLIMGVKRGYRIAVLALFVLLFCALTSTLSINMSTPRFSVLVIALFALLWGNRAKTNPLLVSIAVLISSWLPLHFARTHDLQHWVPSYNPNIEPHRSAGAALKGDTMLIFSRGLAVESFFSGRLGEWRFEFADCSNATSYEEFLKETATRYRWVLFTADTPTFKFGPEYHNKLRKQCPTVSAEDFKRALQATGWRFHSKPNYTDELWTTKAEELKTD